MANRTAKTPEDYVVPLRMNGLEGRMLAMPAPKGKSRQILMVYGSHASLERMFGMAEAFSKYGAVTVPDLPGFGGMQSFYKIGKKPTIDNLADYLAAFVKLRYKRKRVTIVGVSLGFVIATRMLQKYPELSKKVDLLVSAAGFTHKDDFGITKPTKLLFRFGPVIFSWRVSAWLLQTFVLRGPIIRTAYRVAGEKNAKLHHLSPEAQAAVINFEVGLWKANDIRTYMDTTISMMNLNLCNAKVDLPVYHINMSGDHFFDHHSVEQHMRVVFTDYIPMNVDYHGHAPTVIADAKEARKLLPRKLINLLNK